MTKDMIIGLLVGLIVGGFIGHQVGSSGSHAPAPVTAAPAMPGGMPPGMPSAPGPEIQARISSLQSVVARDPKNHQAWVQLGNDYFDTHQPQKAIEAYGRALELKPNDPNVLTDQGVMYRDLGQFDKALANFEKASQADPKHVQSLFNIGVVYANDLKQPKKAADAWNKVIQVAPASPQAGQAKQAIAELGPAK
ncbi:MAG TPA: tetratricopeptide repeat protein [Anaeromyxobacter sp.]|nr:tetratricopeptide repeat protein [Anaeromyxobacter sp.]